MTNKPMLDSEFIRNVDDLFTEIMPQAGKLVFQDYGKLNATLMELTRRRRLFEQSAEEADSGMHLQST